MPEFKQLSYGETLAAAEKYLLIERFCEPACGDQYRFSGRGCDLSSEYTYGRLEDACARALVLAKARGISVIYLSHDCVPPAPGGPSAESRQAAGSRTQSSSRINGNA